MTLVARGLGRGNVVGSLLANGLTVNTIVEIINDILAELQLQVSEKVAVTTAVAVKQTTDDALGVVAAAVKSIAEQVVAATSEGQISSIVDSIDATEVVTALGAISVEATEAAVTEAATSAAASVTTADGVDEVASISPNEEEVGTPSTDTGSG
jgi:hypothetical protein